MCSATDTVAVKEPGEEAATDGEEEEADAGRGGEEEETGAGLGLSLARVSANLFLLASAASLLTTVVGEVEKSGLLDTARRRALSSLEIGGTPKHRAENDPIFHLHLRVGKV